MSIAEFIKGKAIAELWANPHGDKNVVLQTVRMTGSRGAIGTLCLPFTNILLPNNSERFAVHELGGILLRDVGIYETLYGWTPIRNIVNTSQTLVQLFTNGRLANLDSCYIKAHSTGNVIIAIAFERNSYMLDQSKDLYVRFYSNIYYTGMVDPAKKISTLSYINDSADVGKYIAFVSAVNAIEATNGVSVLLYFNGLLMSAGIPAQNKMVDGDLLEYIVDPFIKRRESLLLSDLKSFTSTVDNTNKVILSLDESHEYIYVDDLEFYVTGIRDSDGLRVGSYFPRLRYSTIRMLTFKDWSLNSLLVNARVDEMQLFSDTGNLSQVRIEILLRDNGEQRQTILDNNRLTDLMNLPLGKRTEAISGVNSNLDIWKAATLEDCPLVKFMGTEVKDVSTFDYDSLYSRSAVISALERVRYDESVSSWTLPSSASNGGGKLVVFDSVGFNMSMLSYSALDHSYESYADGKGYEVFLPGYKALDPLDTVITTNDSLDTTIENGFGIFCYYNQDGTLTRARNGFEYTLVEGVGVTDIVWDDAMHQYERYVRTSQKIVYFTKTISFVDIIAGVDVYDGRTMVNDIGMGNIYVWVAGRYMIEELDYYVKNSKIYLRSNHTFITNATELKVIYAGLPNDSLQHESKGNWGWVKYGKINVDNIYDLDTRRNNWFSIGGAITFGDEILTDESLVDKSAPVTHADGLPYGIIPLVEFARKEDVDAISRTTAQEQTVDDMVSSYITVKYPQGLDDALITIPSKYDLVSMYLATIIEDIDNNTIIATSTIYSDSKIALMTLAYTELLTDDVTKIGHDLEFVEIHPMWNLAGKTVSSEEYIFINRVNEFMLDGAVSGLNLYLTIV